MFTGWWGSLFTRLNKLQEVEQVVDRLTEKFYNQLDNEEKGKLSLSEVKKQTCKIPANINQVNVRKIGKLVEEIISLLLIRIMLKDG